MTRDERERYARIMIEGGCSVEDVAMTLGMTFKAALYAVAPALKCNDRARRRARQFLASMKASPDILVIHKPSKQAVAAKIAEREERIAA